MGIRDGYGACRGSVDGAERSLVADELDKHLIRVHQFHIYAVLGDSAANRRFRSTGIGLAGEIVAEIGLAQEKTPDPLSSRANLSCFLYVFYSV